jgi:hypothetical protein
MFFTGFVQERGPPWRPCDLWDELDSNIGDHLRQESQDQRLLLVHIQVQLNKMMDVIKRFIDIYNILTAFLFQTVITFNYFFPLVPGTWSAVVYQ